MVTKRNAATRPMTGADLRAFKDRYGFSDSVMSDLLGISLASLHPYYTSDVIPDPSVAITLRLYLENPELVPRPSETSIWEMLEAINQELREKGREPLNLRSFSTLMGRSPSTAFGWDRKTNEPSRSVMALVAMLFRIKKGKRATALLSVVRKEGAARGVRLFDNSLNVLDSWSDSAKATYRKKRASK